MRKKKMPDQSVKEYKIRKLKPNTKGKGFFPASVNILKSLRVYTVLEILTVYTFFYKGEGGYNV
jgi:hypothetical protein